MSPAAADFESILALRPLPGGRPPAEAVLARLAQASRALVPTDGLALRFWQAPGAMAGHRPVGPDEGGGLGEGLLSIAFSPSGRHVALMWAPWPGAWTRLWLDGREVAVPMQGDGRPLAVQPSRWCDARTFSICTVPLHHPQQDWSDTSGTGSVRGLLLCDVETPRQRLVEPGPDEAWAEPWAEVVDAQAFRIHGDPGAAPRRVGW